MGIVLYLAMNSNQVKRELRSYSDKQKAEFYPRFFKTQKGEYGYGDHFIGVTVPHCRLVANKYRNLELSETHKLLNSPIHEERMVALFILIFQFEDADQSTRKNIFNYYVRNKSQINNWDLVDLSSYKIVGSYLLDKPRDLLYKLSKSKNLWDKRISIVSTYAFIRQNDFETTLDLSKHLLTDNNDLIHKAVGWMLREVGKRDKPKLNKFLNRYSHKMPRTMLRYAIEKFPQDERMRYLNSTH